MKNAILLAAITWGTLVMEASPGPQAGSQPSIPLPGSTRSTGTTLDPNRPPGTRSSSGYPFNRAIYITGKVTLDNGSPPPDPVPIECACGNRSRTETYTDTKGKFTFRFGQSEGSVQDASVDLSAARSASFYGSLTDCEVLARLAGYSSDRVDISNRRTSDSPNVGTIVLRRMGKSEGSSISMTSLQAPKSARKAYERAMEQLRKGNRGKASQELEKAVAAYPRYAAAWCELGALQQTANQDEDARHSFQQAMAADPQFIKPYLQMAMLAWRHNAWQIMSENSARVVKLDPVEYPQAYLAHSIAAYNLHLLDDAEQSARAVMKIDAKHRFPQAYRVLGTVLAEKRNYQQSLVNLNLYLQYAPEAQDATSVRSRIAELEKMQEPKPD